MVRYCWILHHSTALCGGGGGGIMPLCTSSVSNTVLSEVNHFLPGGLAWHTNRSQQQTGHCNYLVQHQHYLHAITKQKYSVQEKFGQKGNFHNFVMKSAAGLVHIHTLHPWLRGEDYYYLVHQSHQVCSSCQLQIEEGEEREDLAPSANMAEVQHWCPPVVSFPSFFTPWHAE